MIQLAFSTNAFKKNTLEEAIRAIARIGYRGVEIMADVPHAHPATLSGPRRRQVRELIRDLGLRVSNVNAFTLFAQGDTYHPTWIESNAAKRQQRIDHTLACIELTAEFGAATISLQPGGPLIGTGLTRDQAGDRFAEGLGRVLPVARQAGVILAIEPEPGLFIESADEYRQFKQQYFPNESFVAMNCDIGHLYCVGDDPAEVIRSQPDQIAHIHLEDIGANHVHQHLVPGKGAIDFPKLFAAIEHIGYAGWVTVELYPYETTAAGVAQAAWDHLTTILPSMP
ncbi:MAG TPA: sugar phosphate isomerase/epimerase family protein [Tepidisphaeraceae bacterium]|nr:sugar phosphate isomerase/epimerase family protein [Tepidisphaeraceae bacterium]